ncbi:hypothetical protein, partial [Acinetobacter sp. CAAS 2-6]|uniref:hypothetical protein n=1 Tax=Acinetobacter sp. CAAS 2-6 TaxID=3016358 RepID=UPI002DD634AF
KILNNLTLGEASYQSRRDVRILGDLRSFATPILINLLWMSFFSAILLKNLFFRCIFRHFFLFYAIFFFLIGIS